VSKSVLLLDIRALSGADEVHETLHTHVNDTQEGGNYVPVAELPPLPEAHGTNEEGLPMPLPNVEPVFLTGSHCV